LPKPFPILKSVAHPLGYCRSADHRGGIEDFGFPDLAMFEIGFPVLASKICGFGCGVFYGLRFFLFLAFSFPFSASIIAVISDPSCSYQKKIRYELEIKVFKMRRLNWNGSI